MRKCSVCILPRDERVEIDKKILQGISLQAISDEVNISTQVLNRHKAHTSRQLMTSEKGKDLLSIDGISDLAIKGYQELEDLLIGATRGGDIMAAVACLREKRGLLTLAAGLGIKYHELMIEQQKIDKPLNIKVGFQDFDLKRLDREELKLFSNLLAKVKGEVIPSKGRDRVDDRELKRLKEGDAKVLKDIPSKEINIKHIPEPVEILEDEIEELNFDDERDKHPPGWYPGVDKEGYTFEQRMKPRSRIETAGSYKRKTKLKRRIGSIDDGLGDAISEGKVRVSNTFPRR